MSWITILLLMSISGGFGGILDVLQIIDVRKLIEQPGPVLVSRRRFFAALVLGMIGGVGGAVAMLFVIVATAKLDTTDTPANRILLCSLGLISGFLGYRVLRSVAQRVEKQIQEVEVRTEKKIEEKTAQAVAIADEKIQKSSSDLLDYFNAISKGLYVAGSEDVPPPAVEEAISALEQIIKRTPDDRQASIVLSNIYAQQKNYDKSIEVLNNLIKALQNKGEARNKDIGDALYNRACILNTKAEGLPSGSPELLEINEKIYSDLAASFRLAPDNKEEAKKDIDLESLTGEERFRQLTG